MAWAFLLLTVWHRHVLDPVLAICLGSEVAVILLPASPATSVSSSDPANQLPLVRRCLVMLFDIYEHPAFEATYEDKLRSPVVARRLGVGMLTTLLAATAVWRYFWTDRSPVPLRHFHTDLTNCEHWSFDYIRVVLTLRNVYRHTHARPATQLEGLLLDVSQHVLARSGFGVGRLTAICREGDSKPAKRSVTRVDVAVSTNRQHAVDGLCLRLLSGTCMMSINETKNASTNFSGYTTLDNHSVGVLYRLYVDATSLTKLRRLVDGRFSLNPRPFVAALEYTPGFPSEAASKPTLVFFDAVVIIFRENVKERSLWLVATSEANWVEGCKSSVFGAYWVHASDAGTGLVASLMNVNEQRAVKARKPRCRNKARDPSPKRAAELFAYFLDGLLRTTILYREGRAPSS
ncbi:hypothetical protein K488DRAFT_71087 [Vararia minispora EC-137]|uniref:Uncharacterized protein n=1 Tax=Vararia minispora EC-137 TaxID=1314806 RepID=A0ACB8QJF9_9AGAM|nr:hypothetical protein K488DRAFT_71087 [Vararia minispora EC-137]